MSTDDPAFWEDWYADDVVKPQGWDELGVVERCIVGHDGAGLDEAIANYLGRSCGDHWLLGDDPEAVRRVMPEFRKAVRSLITRRSIEVRLLPSESSGWDDAPATDPEVVGAALSDPRTWLGRLAHSTLHLRIGTEPISPRKSIAGQ